jgi:hypothetical protein
MFLKRAGFVESVDMLPLARNAPTSGVTVFDLRPLRRLLYSGRLGQVGPDVRRVIYGYVAPMWIGGAREATETLINRAPGTLLNRSRQERRQSILVARGSNVGISNTRNGQLKTLSQQPQQ